MHGRWYDAAGSKDSDGDFISDQEERMLAIEKQVPPPPAPTTRPRTAPARVPPEVDETEPFSLNVLPKPPAGPRGPQQPRRGARAAERAAHGSASGRRRSGSRFTARRARPRLTA